MSKSELDLQGLVQDVSLRNITFYEIAASRKQGTQSSEPPAEGNAEVESLQSLRTGSRDDDTGFRVALKTEIDVDQGTITVEAAAEYDLDQFVASAISPELMVIFANDVAVMQLLPYLRQAIADISQRVFGTPLLMPLLQRGDMEFKLGNASEISSK